MLTLKVLSALLSYPQRETLEALHEMASAVEREDVLSRPHKTAVLDFIISMRQSDLIDWQERYVATFDQGRSLSLHMFEHVHGESRARGQAMVDLLEFYRRGGFEVAVSELPDYLPLFLEFLAYQTPDKSVQLLKEVLPVVSILRTRLKERGSGWHVVFDALASLSGQAEDQAPQAMSATACPDASAEAVDRQWAEVPQNFMTPMDSGSPCQSCKVATTACQREAATGGGASR